jgi:hypothetical protein
MGSRKTSVFSDSHSVRRGIFSDALYRSGGSFERKFIIPLFNRAKMRIAGGA